MGECWYCHWGWHPRVQAVYDRYARLIDDANDKFHGVRDGENALKYGNGHIVWADENFERHHVEWSAKQAFRPEVALLESMLVRRSLRELLRLPDSVLESKPLDYDGRDPEKYPPPWAQRAVSRATTR